MHRHARIMADTEINNNGLSRVQPEALLSSSSARRKAMDERDEASMMLEVRPPSEILAEKRNKMEKRHQELKFERRAVMRQYRERVRSAGAGVRARRRAQSRNGFVLSRHGRPVSARVPRNRPTPAPHHQEVPERGGQVDVPQPLGGFAEESKPKKTLSKGTTKVCPPTQPTRTTILFQRGSHRGRNFSLVVLSAMSI